MSKRAKVLTILGSPHSSNSNTRTLVEDFLAEVEKAGLPVEHRVISLGEMKVQPCAGCWACTKGLACPLSRKDSLDEIKRAMLECDLVILASPVYTNQITAQMKALFDRLFTWCHIFPLLGKYGMSASTTGNEGIVPVKNFLQKMLATWGTSSLGHIGSKGGFTPGYFPLRDRARKSNRKLARKVAHVIGKGKRLPVSTTQKRIFKVMKGKFHGANSFRYLADTDDKSDTIPSAFNLFVMKRLISRIGLNSEDIGKIARMMSFEYSWWRDRNWFSARSFRKLAATPIPEEFDIKQRLLGYSQSDKMGCDKSKVEEG